MPARTASWTYDARERVTSENPGTGSATTFTLDVRGNVTQEVTGAATTTRTFAGEQLQTEDFSSGQDKRYLYDSLGSTDCVVKLTYAGTSCPAAGHVDLLEDNLYDYKSRLAGFRAYNGTGGLTKSVDYTNDPLDRPVKQVETTPAPATTIDFTYVGVTNALSKEVLSGGTSSTKKYAYDAFGNRATITEGANRYSYLYDPHGCLAPDRPGEHGQGGVRVLGLRRRERRPHEDGRRLQREDEPVPLHGQAARFGLGHLRHGCEALLGLHGRFLQYDVFYDALRQPRPLSRSAESESLCARRRQPRQLRRGRRASLRSQMQQHAEPREAAGVFLEG